MVRRPHGPDTHITGSVSDRQPVNAAVPTPKTPHVTQAKEIKPPKINGKYASAAPVIELQPILLQLSKGVLVFSE